MDAEGPHVLEGGADELDGAALAGVALLEEVDRAVERLPAPLLQGCNSIDVLETSLNLSPIMFGV